MSTPFATPYTAMARVRVINATVSGEHLFIAAAEAPNVPSILVPAGNVVETSLERVRMADAMHQALCRIAECNTLASALGLAEMALVECDRLQAREIDAEIAGARPAVEATQACLRNVRIAEGQS